MKLVTMLDFDSSAVRFVGSNPTSVAYNVGRTSIFDFSKNLCYYINIREGVENSMASLIDQYSKQELEQIVLNSKSYKDVIQQLGYSTVSGSNTQTVRRRLEKYNISTEHFTSVRGIKRNEENVFIKDSTANQQTLRRWYIKGNYTPYICSICGQEPFWQGKDLTLILDHINGHNHDDRLENLRWVCPNCNQQLPTTGYKKLGYTDTKLSKRQIFCKDCGKLISQNAIRCKSCDTLFRQQNSTLKVDRNELKNLIRTVPFITIGKQFGVSDNAIRKWCKIENLPYTKKEIKSYSDKEWDLI